MLLLLFIFCRGARTSLIFPCRSRHQLMKPDGRGSLRVIASVRIIGRVSQRAQFSLHHPSGITKRMASIYFHYELTGCSSRFQVLLSLCYFG
jgi:hypothetical protein